jgi:hypothetical protein
VVDTNSVRKRLLAKVLDAFLQNRVCTFSTAMTFPITIGGPYNCGSGFCIMPKPNMRPYNFWNFSLLSGFLIGATATKLQRSISHANREQRQT